MKFIIGALLLTVGTIITALLINNAYGIVSILYVSAVLLSMISMFGFFPQQLTLITGMPIPVNRFTNFLFVLGKRGLQIASGMFIGTFLFKLLRMG